MRGGELLESEERALLRTFRSDADDHLSTMEELLLALTDGHVDTDAMHHLLRLAHTLKGDASCLGFEAITDYAHGLESELVQVRDGNLELTPPTVRSLLAAVDHLRAMIFGGAGKRATAGEGAGEPDTPDDPGEAASPDGGSANGRGRGGSGGGPGGGSGGDRANAAHRSSVTVRVGIEELDRLLRLLGEIASVRGTLSHHIEGLEGPDKHRALDAHANLERMHVGLQELLLQIRMVPLSNTFRAYQRAVRDIALEVGKQARLVLVGGDVEVDAAVVEPLRELLSHLVRNAVDHGIELPEERVAAGKDPVGTVQIKSFHDMGHVVIEVQDDGRGLDRERIVEAARDRGLVPEDADVATADLSWLIFEPGLSTAASVTRLSGRGVGMDAARRSVQTLKGQLDVASTPGKGTTITIRLPLSLARGFALMTCGQTYVVPLDSVVECVDGPADLTKDDRETAVIDLRGSALPVLRLGRVLGMGSGSGARESVVVLEHAQGRVGLSVERLLGECQTSAQPLAAPCDEAFGIAGSTILQDGEVALLLDVAQVVAAVEAAAGDDVNETNGLPDAAAARRDTT